MSYNGLKYNYLNILQEQSPEFVKKISNNLCKNYSIATFNVKGDLNLGTMIRTSLYFNCKKVYYFRDKKFDRRYCIGTNHYMNLEYINIPFNDWLVNYNIYPVFIEQGGEDLSKNLLKEHLINSKDKDKEFCLIFGNENSGIPNNLLSLGYPVVTIPSTNVVPRSLSVSMSCGIVLYELSKVI